MLTQQLKDQIKRELEDDLSRYDDDYWSWVEVVRDCPSDTLEKLMGQVGQSDDEQDALNLFIDDMIDSLEPSDD